ATTFESQLRDSRPEAEIVAPAEGSEEATVASSSVADKAAERLDQNFEDNYDSIDWLRLPRFTKPLITSRRKPSWIYQHGYRVILLTDPEQVFWVCRYCHIHKYIDAGRGGVFPAAATTQAARHLCELRPGHSHQLPSKPRSVVNEGSIRSLFKSKVPVPQEVANELGNFNIQRFRLAAPAFRDMIAIANPEAEAALWQSHKSVRQYVLRLYNHLQPRVIYELSRALSRIHVSFDGWTTKGGKRGYLGIVAHYVNRDGNLVDLPIALPQLMGAHSGENMAEIVYSTLQKFGVGPRTTGYFVLDNASSNDTTIVSLAQKMSFNATYRRLRCGPRTLNLISQTLLWGKDSDTYDNYVSEVVTVDTEHKLMRPLKTATKQLKGRGKSGSFGSIAKIIPVFEVLFSKFEEKLQNYDAVNYY
ncbi:hypothetical protein KJE20_14078, partial [Pyrenophora tritici-repentis]